MKVDLVIVLVRVEFERELLKGFPDLPVVGILKNILMFFWHFNSILYLNFYIILYYTIQVSVWIGFHNDIIMILCFFVFSDAQASLALMVAKVFTHLWRDFQSCLYGCT